MEKTQLETSSGAKNWRRVLSLSALVAREAIAAYAANRNLASAATLAYYGFLSLMPLLLSVVFLLGFLMQSSEAVRQAVGDLTQRLFPEFSDTVVAELLEVARRKGWGFTGFVVLLWSMTPFVGALRGTVGLIFRAQRRFRFFVSKLFDLGAVLAILCLFVALAAGKLVPTPHEALAAGFWPRAGRGICAYLLTAVVLTLFYAAFCPVRVRPAHVIAGASAGALLLGLIRPVFGVVLRVNPNYGYAFGSLKTIFLLLVWVYYTFAVVLFGAELVAALRRKDALVLRRLFRGARLRERTMPLLARFVRSLAPREVLFREHEPGAEMYYVLSGAVALSRGGQLLATMRPGDYFGELSMLLQAPRTATATAAEPGTQVVRISRDNFELILRENPDIVLALLKEMGSRLRATDEVLERREQERGHELVPPANRETA